MLWELFLGPQSWGQLGAWTINTYKDWIPTGPRAAWALQLLYPICTGHPNEFYYSRLCTMVQNVGKTPTVYPISKWEIEPTPRGSWGTMCFHCSATNDKPQSCSHLLCFPCPAWLHWACPCQWQFCPPYFQDVGLVTSSPCSQACGLEHRSMLLIGRHFATLVCRGVGRYWLLDPCSKNLDQEPTSRTTTCVFLVGPERWTNPCQSQWPMGCSMMLPSSLFQPRCSLYHLWSTGCTLKDQHDILGCTRSSHLDSFPQASHQLEWSLLLCHRWPWHTHSWGHFRQSSNPHISSCLSGSQLKDCRSSSLGAEPNQTQSPPACFPQPSKSHISINCLGRIVVIHQCSIPIKFWHFAETTILHSLSH